MELVRLRVRRDELIKLGKLSTVTDRIGDLKALKRFNLWGNALTNLPDGICSMPKLESLILTFNHLESLPISIGDLPVLKTLLLWDNNLKTLPASIGNLTQLKDLYVGKNMLTESELSPLVNLKSLEALDLSHNPGLSSVLNLATYKKETTQAFLSSLLNEKMNLYEVKEDASMKSQDSEIEDEGKKNGLDRAPGSNEQKAKRRKFA